MTHIYHQNLFKCQYILEIIFNNNNNRINNYSNLQIWQLDPEYPGRQLQRKKYPLLIFWHEAPFKHGLLLHGFISSTNKLLEFFYIYSGKF